MGGRGRGGWEKTGRMAGCVGAGAGVKRAAGLAPSEALTDDWGSKLHLSQREGDQYDRLHANSSIHSTAFPHSAVEAVLLASTLIDNSVLHGWLCQGLLICAYLLSGVTRPSLQIPSKLVLTSDSKITVRISSDSTAPVRATSAAYQT